MFHLATTLMVSTLVLACANTHCRHQTSSSQQMLAANTETPKAQVNATEASSSSKSVFVFKFDGSRQCGQGKAVDVKAMAKELSGIKVISSANKNDGKMHTRNCGGPTGQANVYEIPESSAEEAKTRGFELWKN